MSLRYILLPVAALSLSTCDVIDEILGKDKREGDELEEICVGRVRAQLTYEQYQQLENAPGSWIPTYTYDVTLLGLESIQELIAAGADDTAGTRLMQQTNNTSAAVERFMLMKVDRGGALFLGREPALFRVRGRAMPASSILSNGCQAQRTNTRLIEVSWTRSGAATSPKEEAAPSAEPEIDVTDIPNLGGVR